MKIIKALSQTIVLGAIFNLYFLFINGKVENIVHFIIFLGCGLLGYLTICSLFQKNKLFQQNFSIQIMAIFTICTILEILYGILAGLQLTSIIMMIILSIPIVVVGFVYWWHYSKRLNNELIEKKRWLVDKEELSKKNNE